MCLGYERTTSCEESCLGSFDGVVAAAVVVAAVLAVARMQMKLELT